MSLAKQVGPRRTIESRRRMNISDYKKYLEKGLAEGMDIHYESVSPDWVQDFMFIAKEHGKLKNNVAIEYIESWNPEESNKTGYEKLHQATIENTKQAFPGHAFIVVPQVSDNGNFHNHVLVSAVSDSGKRLLSNYTDRKKWKAVCDKNSIEMGLSIVDNRSSQQKERLTKNARQSLRTKGNPVQLQIMQKADFARILALDFEDYANLMLSLGIEVVDQGKVLSYFHPNTKKAIRDRRFGSNYCKPELEKQFRRNKNEFKSRPGLYKKSRSELKSRFDERGNYLGDPGSIPLLPGGHQKFETIRQGKGKNGAKKLPEMDFVAKHFESISHWVQGHIDLARNKSIVEYCNTKNIPLVENEDGTFNLKGKEFITVKDNRWINNKVKRSGYKIGTGGSLIEFVANHKDLTLLEAVAHITNNSNLLLLQNYLGREKRNYKEFHIPRLKTANKEGAYKLLKNLSHHVGKSSSFTKSLLNMKNIKVGIDNIVQLFDSTPNGGVTEFKLNKDGEWEKSSRGLNWGGLLSQFGNSSKVTVFADPFTFMDVTKGKGKMSFKGNDNLLVLPDKSDTSALDFFLAKQPRIKDIDLFGFASNERQKEIKGKYQELGININFIDLSSYAKAKSKGLDIGL